MDIEGRPKSENVEDRRGLISNEEGGADNTWFTDLQLTLILLTVLGLYWVWVRYRTR